MNGRLDFVLFLTILYSLFVPEFRMLSVHVEPQDNFKMRFAPGPFGPLWQEILKESLSGIRAGPLPDLNRITDLCGQLLHNAGNHYTVALSAGQLWARGVAWFGSVEAMAEMGHWIDGGDAPPGHLLPERFVLPTGQFPLNQQNIDRLISALIPLEQALPILPELWRDCGLGSLSVDQHFEELLALNVGEPDTADLIFRGDLIEAEKRLLNTKWLALVRRSAVLWLFADLFRTGLLVRSLNDIARRATELNKVLTQGAQKARAADARGPWLRTGSALANVSAGYSSIAGLIFYPDEGKKPKFREKDDFKQLHDCLKRSPVVQANNASLKDSGVHYRFKLGNIGSALRFHSRATNHLRSQPQKSNSKPSELESMEPTPTPLNLADKSAFEIIAGLQPLPATITVAILIEMALEILRDGVQDQQNPILERVALTPWSNNGSLELRTNFNIVIQLIRVHWWNYEVGKNSNVNWRDVDLNERSDILSARINLRAEKLLQTETRQARDFMKGMKPLKDDALALQYDLPRARNFIDISMRYRN